jgi:hypothetical protein
MDLQSISGAGLALAGLALSIVSLGSKTQTNIGPSPKGGFQSESVEYQIIKRRRLFVTSFCVIAAGIALQLMAALI